MNILKKQSVAWIITLVMVIAAIGIGRAKANASVDTPAPGPAHSASAGTCYVYDYAGVLSEDELTKLSNINSSLLNSKDVVIACVTVNYGRSDLYEYAMNQAEKIGLRENDFIVVLDISGDNYWLIQGAGLIDQFSDDDCADYAWDYMESYFAEGDYGGALVSLAGALSDWYRANY